MEAESALIGLLLISGVAVNASAYQQMPPRVVSGPEGLLRWAARISHRKLPENIAPPQLIALSDRAMREMVCPDVPDGCASLAAAYSIKTGVIYYRESFSLDKLLHRSYLVHEMVHFLQHLDLGEKVNDSCRRIFRLEREAYGVQAAYLRRHGSIHAGQAMPRAVACQPGSDPASDER